MMQTDKPGDYLLASGENHSVREFAELAARYFGFDLIWKGAGLEEQGLDRKTGRTIIAIDPKYFRPAEVDNLLGDPSRARKELGWKPKISFAELVREMCEADFNKENK